MEQREKTIRLWFDMWLQGKDLGIDRIFTPNCIYIESWGPKYEGLSLIKHWFEEWNTRGKVLVWEIKQYFHQKDQTVVEWFFQNQMNDGRQEKFDGISLIHWSEDGKINYLKEFGCRIPHYNPYQNGDQPELFHTDMWTNQ